MRHYVILEACLVLGKYNLSNYLMSLILFHLGTKRREPKYIKRLKSNEGTLSHECFYLLRISSFWRSAFQVVFCDFKSHTSVFSPLTSLHSKTDHRKREVQSESFKRANRTLDLKKSTGLFFEKSSFSIFSLSPFNISMAALDLDRRVQYFPSW